LRSCGTYRQLRSDATTLALALGNTWKTDLPAYCNGRYCGRRAAILYRAGELFA
jgi:hypothetical protein